MIFMGDRCPEKRHYAIAGELVNGPFKFVDFIHQDLETPIHDIVDFFGIKLFGYCGVVGHIGKKNRHKLALALDRTTGGEDFVSQEFGRIVLRL